MNNLQPPDYEPQLSDVRTRTSPAAATAGSSSSAPTRRNATRIARRNDSHRAPWELSSRGSSARMRRLTNFMRAGYLSPPAQSSQPEPSSKRRKTERNGQIEMEQLPLELRYCDGGRYDSGRFYANEYSPECALRDDSTVYCTKAPSCNMILRHVNGQCFSLQKLVIRAPPSGYTSPVRAGMIFVTMDETDLLSKTDYNVRYEKSDDEDEDTSEDEASDFRLLDSDPCEADAETDMRRSIFIPAPHRTSEGMTGSSRLHPGSSPAPMMGSSSSSSLWANLDEQFSRPPPPVELLEPNATFSHKDKRTKCVINFEPAISGRFILAKFFSTHQSRNIDIEFVGAFGWTGRRFFPAITMR